MYNYGRSGWEIGLFRSVFVWGLGRYGVGLYARPFHRDTRGSTKLGRLSNFTEGAIYKIACLDE